MTELFALTVLLSPPDVVDAGEAQGLGFTPTRSAYEMLCPILATVEDSISTCAARLESLRSGLDLPPSAKIELVAGISVKGNGGIVLGDVVLQHLAAVGAELVFDIYCDE